MGASKFSRRRFLGLLTTLIPSIFLWSSAKANEKQGSTHHVPEKSDRASPSIGIALGGGGANGLAHILMLEAIDEMAIRPQHVAGTSIGAVIGAFYASGMTGKQIRELVERFIISPDKHLVKELINKNALRWVEFLDIELGDGGVLSSEGFMSFMYEHLKTKTFEELKIPLKITAADLWSRDQVVFHSGFNSVKVMQRAIMNEKLQHEKPAIYITPRIVDIRSLEFYRAREVFAQARPAQEKLKQRLAHAVKAW